MNDFLVRNSRKWHIAPSWFLARRYSRNQFFKQAKSQIGDMAIFAEKVTLPYRRPFFWKNSVGLWNYECTHARASHQTWFSSMTDMLWIQCYDIYTLGKFSTFFENFLTTKKDIERWETLSTKRTRKVAWSTLKFWTNSCSCLASHFIFRRFM